jgi:hypothetical protein
MAVGSERGGFGCSSEPDGERLPEETRSAGNEIRVSERRTGRGLVSLATMFPSTRPPQRRVWRRSAHSQRAAAQYILAPVPFVKRTRSAP